MRPCSSLTAALYLEAPVTFLIGKRIIYWVIFIEPPALLIRADFQAQQAAVWQPTHSDVDVKVNSATTLSCHRHGSVSLQHKMAQIADSPEYTGLSSHRTAAHRHHRSAHVVSVCGCCFFFLCFPLIFFFLCFIFSLPKLYHNNLLLNTAAAGFTLRRQKRENRARQLLEFELKVFEVSLLLHVTSLLSVISGYQINLYWWHCPEKLNKMLLCLFDSFKKGNQYLYSLLLWNALYWTSA